MVAMVGGEMAVVHLVGDRMAAVHMGGVMAIEHTEVAVTVVAPNGRAGEEAVALAATSHGKEPTKP